MREGTGGLQTRPYAGAWGRGLVGVTGLEPATPCTPCRCATKLRYTPTFRQHSTPGALGSRMGCTAEGAEGVGIVGKREGMGSRPRLHGGRFFTGMTIGLWFRSRRGFRFGCR